MGKKAKRMTSGDDNAYDTRPLKMISLEIPNFVFRLIDSRLKH